MRKVIFFILLFLVIASSASAEDDYHLRVPEVQEYGDLMTDIAYRLTEADDNELAHRATFDAMSVILFDRFTTRGVISYV